MPNIDMKLAPQAADSSLVHGNEDFRRGLYESAIIHYHKALEENPHLSGAINLNIRLAKRRYLLKRQSDERKSVVVCGWDLAHNAAGRAYTLARIYQNFYKVKIVGTIFPKNGSDIWYPIRDAALEIQVAVLNDDGQDYEKIRQIVLNNPCDILHLSKPRITNILFGVLYKEIWGATVLVDIDDEELSFVGAKKQLELQDYFKKHSKVPPLKGFSGLDWTRIAVSFVHHFDGVTVANEALQARYGGSIIRHAREGVDNAPAAQKKRQSRLQLGIDADKKIILFFGTARPHKGLIEIAKSIAMLKREDLLFLVVGDFPDTGFLAELKAIENCAFQFLGMQKVTDIPLVVSCADICILYQAEDSEIARFQTPAKLSDALAQGVPVLANDVPAMKMLFAAGAATAIQGTLSDSLNRLLDDHEQIEKSRVAATELFTQEFSVLVNSNRLQALLKGIRSAPLSEELSTLKEIFEPSGVAQGVIQQITPLVASAKKGGFDVDIVVPVYNALDDVKLCLASLALHTDGLKVRAIVVNDGSDEGTTRWLRDYCAEHRFFKLIEHEANLGYTKAVNSGLKASTAAYVITQNSDTIVSSGWLAGLVRCIESSQNIGIAGPLSNAASWQNAPDLYDESGAFAVNTLPQGLSVDDMARVVAHASRRLYPRTPFVNGFCFMIKRQVIDSIGFMDEENFPIGYGEENDFCIRAADAGYEFAIADDVYVFHAKSKSFGHDRRKELSKQGSENLRAKHTPEKFKLLLERVKDTSALDEVRQRIITALKQATPASQSIDLLSMHVLFLLPVKGGGGGAHSVVQEVAEMRRLGINAHVAVRREHLDGFLLSYADIPHAQTLFAGFDNESLLALAENYDVVVGTIFSSMAMVKRIVECNQHILPAYYVQDYEPMFFETGSQSWKSAFDSYSLVPGTLLFAKTHWIINEVAQAHKVQVQKVSPSIDHEVYRPQTRHPDGRIHVVAMVRPGTPRRGASRTMRVLKALQLRHGDRLAVHIFGSLEESKDFLPLERDFSYVNHGILKRPEVAKLLSACDIFLDLSDYQAFGRTGLEAMACGCAVVLPIVGGADEYAIDGENSLVIDTLDEGLCIQRVSSLIEDPDLLKSIKLSALLTASRYSVHMAAVSEILHLSKHLSAHRRLFPKLQKKVVVLLPHLMKDGTPSGLAYERIIIPYTKPEIQSIYRLDIERKLPEAGRADVVVIQRDVEGYSIEEIRHWHDNWRTLGSCLIFDIDFQFCFANKQRVVDERIQLLVSLADIVATPNEMLVTHFPEICDKIRILPTVLDAEIWSINPVALTEDFPRLSEAPISIGLFIDNGSLDAYPAIKNAIKALKQKYGEKVLFEAVSREKHFELDVCARVGYPKGSGYFNFIRWMKGRIHWDVCLIPIASDISTGGEYSPSIRHIQEMGCFAVASHVAADGQDVSRSNNLVVVDGSEFSWFRALSKFIEENKYRRMTKRVNANHHVAPQITKKLLDVLTGKQSD